MADQSQTYSDQPLRFSLPDRHARGRVLRLDDVLAEVLAAHAYPPVIERILAEALTLTALLGASLKSGRPRRAVHNSAGLPCRNAP